MPGTGVAPGQASVVPPRRLCEVEIEIEAHDIGGKQTSQHLVFPGDLPSPRQNCMKSAVDSFGAVELPSNGTIIALRAANAQRGVASEQQVRIAAQMAFVVR
jgi:hypothetical protein